MAELKILVFIRSVKMYKTFTGFSVLKIVGLACSFAANLAFADSPITTPILWTAYSDVPLVQQVKPGVLTPEIAKALADSTLKIDEKIAVVNKLGWDFSGKHNADLFKKELANKYNEPKLAKNQPELYLLKSDELLVLGYLTVMDDYFHPENAVGILSAAKVNEPNSLTVNLILGLTLAQLASHVAKPETECLVWSAVAESLAKPSPFIVDIRPQAVENVRLYMSNYNRPCG